MMRNKLQYLRLKLAHLFVPFGYRVQRVPLSEIATEALRHHSEKQESAFLKNNALYDRLKARAAVKIDPS